MEPLAKLGFDVVGYGCTTCIGNSGPLAPEISAGRSTSSDLSVVLGALGQPQLRGPHPSRLPHELPRVAAARRRVRARRHDGRRPRERAARRRRATATRSSCATSGRRPSEIADVVGSVHRDRDVRAALRDGSRRRRALARAPRTRPASATRGIDTSTYIRKPPFLEGIGPDAGRRRPTSTARACSRCSATASPPTTSRPPASSGATVPPAEWLLEHGVDPRTSTPTARGAGTTR